MIKEIKLTVMFEDPFWIGVFECQDGSGLYSVSKVTFGAEPTDVEVFEFIKRNFYKLKPKEVKLDGGKKTAAKKKNPKRVFREIKKEAKNKGIGTKAQNAIKEQYEENKAERKKARKARKEENEQRLFELKQQKRKEKHRGH